MFFIYANVRIFYVQIKLMSKIQTGSPIQFFCFHHPIFFIVLSMISFNQSYFSNNFILSINSPGMLPIPIKAPAICPAIEEFVARIVDYISSNQQNRFIVNSYIELDFCFQCFKNLICLFFFKIPIYLYLQVKVYQHG